MCKIILSCILTPIIALLSLVIITGSVLLVMYDKWMTWMNTIFNMSTINSGDIHSDIIDTVAVSSILMIIVIAILCVSHKSTCC